MDKGPTMGHSRRRLRSDP